MTKAELLADVLRRLDSKNTNSKDKKEENITEGAFFPQKEQVQICLETILDAIKDNMSKGHNIYMRGFGTFVNKKRARKKGRNVKANKEVIVEAHYTPSFKPSKSFSKVIKESENLNEKLKEDITKSIN